MLNSTPNLNKYSNSPENVKAFTRAIIDPNFGSSVLLPVGKYGGRRDKKNPLQDQISGTNIEVVFAGGYY